MQELAASLTHHVADILRAVTLSAMLNALQVKWGEHSMVEALRALLRGALKDPLNQRFQLLCEYSLPLQSPLLVYQQFIKEPKSRLNACNTFDWQEHVSSLPVCKQLHMHTERQCM